MIVRYNKNHHVIEEHAYKPNLQDVPHPNLHRKIFTYGEIPKTAFNMRHVPMECPKDIFITDTTFRDGQQATKPFAVKDIVELYKMLHRLGGPNGLVRQSEFFLYSEKDREAVEKCLELGYDFPQVTSWIRASEKDFELVKQFGITLERRAFTEYESAGNAPVRCDGTGLPMHQRAETVFAVFERKHFGDFNDFSRSVRQSHRVNHAVDGGSDLHPDRRERQVRSA